MSQNGAVRVVCSHVANGVIHAGHFVKVDTDGGMLEATVAQAAYGVYIGESDCALGDVIPVCVLGSCKVWADGTSAIARGVYLATDASGHAVVDSTSGHKIQGMALEALASGTAFIEMLVCPSQG